MELLLFWALFGFVGIWIGQKKGFHPVLGFLAGVLLGPLVFLMLIAKQTGKRKCPKCAEFVNSEAIICHYCQSPLTPGGSGNRQCPACGKILSSEAYVCPHCRTPLKKAAI